MEIIAPARADAVEPAHRTEFLDSTPSRLFKRSPNKLRRLPSALIGFTHLNAWLALLFS